MSKRNSAKYKLDRRMGENIWGRPKSPVNKREYGPGQHGQRRKGKVSDFGIQLKAKQKLKGYYGDVTEKQFKKAYVEAARMKGDTGQNLIGLLERRLDAVVYRAKFAPTIFSARQLVSHGHVRVNGVKCNIASRLVKVGDVIELGAKAAEMALVIEAQGLSEREVPDYLAQDGTTKVSYQRVPALDEVPYPVKMEPNLFIEFYAS
jgi:small subunit ribosomal protein S4